MLVGMDANEVALAYQVWQKLSEPRENGAPVSEPTANQLEAIAELVLPETPPESEFVLEVKSWIDGYAWLRGEVAPSEPNTLIMFEGDLRITYAQYKTFNGHPVVVTGKLEVEP